MSEFFRYQPPEEGDQHTYDDQPQQPQVEIIGLAEVLANKDKLPGLDDRFFQTMSLMAVLESRGIFPPETVRRCSLLIEKLKPREGKKFYKIRMPIELVALLPRYANVDKETVRWVDLSLEALSDLFEMGEEFKHKLGTLMGTIGDLEAAHGITVRGDGVIASTSSE